jgi:hypothetical protein
MRKLNPYQGSCPLRTGSLRSSSFQTRFRLIIFFLQSVQVTTYEYLYDPLVVTVLEGGWSAKRGMGRIAEPPLLLHDL